MCDNSGLLLQKYHYIISEVHFLTGQYLILIQFGNMLGSEPGQSLGDRPDTQAGTPSRWRNIAMIGYFISTILQHFSWALRLVGCRIGRCDTKVQNNPMAFWHHLFLITLLFMGLIIISDSIGVRGHVIIISCCLYLNFWPRNEFRSAWCNLFNQSSSDSEPDN